MKKGMKKVFSAIALALTLVLTVPVVLPQTAVTVEAATKKTTLDYKSGEMSIGETYDVPLIHKNSKATYTYKSSKPSVAKVSPKGKITGLKAGKAKISVKQKLKGKTTSVGTFTITVKKAELYPYINDLHWVSAQPGFISEEDPCQLTLSDFVRYINPKAKYTFYSNDSELVISQEGIITEVKSAGISYITMKETYNKKTRTLGRCRLDRKAPTYVGDDVVELTVGEYYYPNTIALGRYNFMWDAEPLSNEEEVISYINKEDDDDSTEDDVLKLTIEDGAWNGEIVAKAPGTRYCAITQYNYLTQKFDKVVAMFKIVVAEASNDDEDDEWDDEDDESDLEFNAQ